MNPKHAISRAELFELIWARPIVRLAAELGYTYTELTVLCTQLNIPRPPAGYWYRKAHGTAEATPDLPPAPVDSPAEIPIGLRRPKEEPAVNQVPEEAEGQLVDATTQLTPEVVEAVPAAAEPAAPRVLEPEEAAELEVLDMLRQRITLEFWRDRIEAKVYASALGAWLGLGRDCKFSRARLVRAIKGVRKEYQTFTVEIGEVPDRYRTDDSELTIELCLREGFEWKEALAEAWLYGEKSNPHGLSDNGWRLYQWAKGPRNTGAMTTNTRIGAQARLKGTYSYVEQHLKEIRMKADATIQWERGKAGRGWHGSFRVWFEAKELCYYHHGPLNPALGLAVVEPGHADWERLREWFHAEVLKAGFPDGTETVGLFDIRSRKAATAAFSSVPMDHVDWGPLPDFFRQWRVVDGVEIRFGFEEDAWRVTCAPVKGESWRGIKDRLQVKAKEIPLELRYELSADSRALLRWILELRRDEFLMGMTPPVESQLDKEIGIKVEWEEKNLRTYLELLVEEINEKTEFKLHALSWHHYSDESTRILVKRKGIELDEIVRNVQMLALRNGKVVPAADLRTEIERMTGQK